MRTLNMTIAALLALGALSARAGTPVQYNPQLRQINQDIRNNQADLSKDRNAYADQQSDLNRDRLDRNDDAAREMQDLSKGNLKGAAHWSKELGYQSSRIQTEQNDLAHTRQDLKADRARLAKDVNVRHKDFVKSLRGNRRI